MSALPDSRPLPAPLETRGALLVVYAGYCARYLSLLILIPYYGRVLGAAEYGKVLTAMSLFTVVWAISNFSLSVVAVRTISGVSDPARLAAEMGRHLQARALMSLLGLAIGLAATWLSPVLRADPFYGLAATATGILAAFNLGWFFQGTRRYRTSILIEAAGFVLHVLLVLALVRRPEDGYLVLAALFTSTLSVTAWGYVLALAQLGRARVRGDRVFGLIREATSLFLVGGVSQLSLNASSYVLSLFASTVEVGHFGSAERLATAVIGMMAPANQVVLGAVSARLKDEEGQEDGHALMGKAMLSLTAFGLVAAVATIGLAPVVVPLMLGPGFEPSVRILQTLALVFPFAGFMQAATVYVLVPLHKERLAMRITLSCAALNLIAMLALAAAYGGLGAAFARVATDVLAAGLLAHVLWKLGLFERLYQRLRR